MQCGIITKCAFKRADADTQYCMPMDREVLTAHVADLERQQADEQIPRRLGRRRRRRRSTTFYVDDATANVLIRLSDQRRHQGSEANSIKGTLPGKTGTARSAVVTSSRRYSSSRGKW